MVSVSVSDIIEFCSLQRESNMSGFVVLLVFASDRTEARVPLAASLLLRLQTIKAIVNSCSFKSPKSDEPRRVQVLDLYCLTRFESESSSREIVLFKTSWRIVYKTFHYIYYTNVVERA